MTGLVVRLVLTSCQVCGYGVAQFALDVSCWICLFLDCGSLIVLLFSVLWIFVDVACSGFFVCYGLVVCWLWAYLLFRLFV